MRRVLHVLTSLGHGGAETWLLNLLQPLEERGVHVDFALKAPHLSASRAETRGARSYHVPLTFTQVGYVQRLARLATENDYDVIHIHEFVYSGLGVLAAKIAHKPCVLTFHHFVFDPQTALTRAPVIRNLRELYGRIGIRYAVSHADAITTLSDAVMDAMVPGHANDPRCRMLRLSAETRARATPEERAEVRKSLGLSPNAPLVLHAGRYMEQKNHAGLLRIFRRVLAVRPDARLVAMGQGPLRDQIVASARDLIEAGFVQILGPRDDVPRLLSAADVLLFPSLSEGFGLVALEANGCGLPVVATRAPGLIEAVVEGETALVHDISDEAGMAASVVRLLEDPQLASALGAAGRERVGRLYSHDASAQLVADVYESVIASHSARHSA